MKNFLPYIKIVFSLIFVAGVAGAYTAPSGTPPNNNTSGPFTMGTTTDIKNGNLALGSVFEARENSLLNQDVYIRGQINGGTPSDINSTISIGNNTSSTSFLNVKTTNTMSVAGTISSDTLKPTPGGNYIQPRPGAWLVCINTNKELELCVDNYNQLLMGKNTFNGRTTSTEACSLQNRAAATTRSYGLGVFYGTPGNTTKIPGFPSSTQIIYDSGTTPVTGGNLWGTFYYSDWGTGYPSRAETWAVQVDNTGQIIQGVKC